MISAFIWPFKMRSQEFYVDGSGIFMTPFKSIFFHTGNAECDILAVGNAWLSLVLLPDFILTWWAFRKYICSKENGVVMETSERGSWHGWGRHQIRCTHRHTETASSCKVREQFPGTVCFMGGFSGTRRKKKAFWNCEHVAPSSGTKTKCVALDIDRGEISVPFLC